MEVVRQQPREGNLDTNWGGPYWVTRNLRNEAYHLIELSERPLPRAWNAVSLRKYYS